MKEFKRELLKREGGKRNLTAADINEVLKHVAEMIVDPTSAQYISEFEKYLAGKKRKTFNKSPKGRRLSITCFIGFRAS